MCKNLEAILFVVDFSQIFYSIHTGKMEQILLAYCLPKETVITIMVLYQNMNAMVHLLDGDTHFFDTIVEVLQGDR